MGIQYFYSVPNKDRMGTGELPPPISAGFQILGKTKKIPISVQFGGHLGLISCHIYYLYLDRQTWVTYKPM